MNNYSLLIPSTSLINMLPYLLDYYWNVLLLDFKMFNFLFMFFTLNTLIIFKNLFTIFTINQMTVIMKTDPQLKMFFIMNFLSLGGLPPCLGFLPKWMTIQLLTENQFFLIAVLMIVITSMTLYFYMRLTFSSILLVTMSLYPHNLSLKSAFLVISTNLMTLMSRLAFNLL